LFKDTPDHPAGGGGGGDALDIFGDRRPSQRSSMFDDLDRYEEVRESLCVSEASLEANKRLCVQGLGQTSKAKHCSNDPAWAHLYAAPTFPRGALLGARPRHELADTKQPERAPPYPGPTR
jgi:hypothetical protein